MGFQDHFSGEPDAYRAYRPTYPDALFRYLAEIAARPATVWECGAGSGQATAGLVRTFPRVIATDPSHAQLRAARGSGTAGVPGAERVVCTAEDAPLPAASVDLVAAAQAFHWFDPARFFGEVRRVSRPGGVLAVWTYATPDIGRGLGEAIRRFSEDTVGRFWPPDRRHVDAGYATIDVPFEELAAPALEMTATWDVPTLLGYVGTWSAVQRARAATGTDPLPRLARVLDEAWPSGENVLVRWPLVVRAFRLS